MTIEQARELSSKVSRMTDAQQESFMMVIDIMTNGTESQRERLERWIDNKGHWGKSGEECIAYISTVILAAN